MSIKLSEAKALECFWKENGDFTRCASYGGLHEKLKKEYPLLFEGIKRIEQGNAMVECALDKMIEESEDDLYFE